MATKKGNQTKKIARFGRAVKKLERVKRASGMAPKVAQGAADDFGRIILGVTSRAYGEDGISMARKRVRQTVRAKKKPGGIAKRGRKGK